MNVDGQRVLGVFVADGHGKDGGSAADAAINACIAYAKTAKELNPAILKQLFTEAQTDVSRVTRQGGSTLTAAFVFPDRVLTAWVGNGEARMVSRDGTIRTLTVPHEYGAHPGEAKRIADAGVVTVPATFFFADAPPNQQYLANGNILLEVTRSLGDPEMGEHILHEPEIVTEPLNPNDRFLIVASDGLWQELRDSARMTLLERACKKPDATDRDVGAHIEHAFSFKKSADNLTAVVVGLKR